MRNQHPKGLHPLHMALIFIDPMRPQERLILHSSAFLVMAPAQGPMIGSQASRMM